MEQISDNKKEIIKQLWKTNCTSLGIGKRLQPLWKFRYKFLIGVSLYALLMWVSTHDVFFSFFPLILFLTLQVLIVMDLVYTSKKCVSVLTIIHKYIDDTIDMYEMLYLIKEDEDLKKDIWF
jgi:hypothetical protein